jgi:putative transposase
LNPVKHKLTNDFSNWKYSSFNAYLSDKPSKINRDLVLEWFGGKEEFKKFHFQNKESYLPEELKLD